MMTNMLMCLVLSCLVQYHAYKARVAAASAKERAGVEKRELEKLEKEGILEERAAAAHGKRGKNE